VTVKVEMRRMEQRQSKLDGSTSGRSPEGRMAV
jgi:hypothetical protein